MRICFRHFLTSYSAATDGYELKLTMECSYHDCGSFGPLSWVVPKEYEVVNGLMTLSPEFVQRGIILWVPETIMHARLA